MAEPALDGREYRRRLRYARSWLRRLRGPRWYIMVDRRGRHTIVDDCKRAHPEAPFNATLETLEQWIAGEQVRQRAGQGSAQPTAQIIAFRGPIT